MNKSTFVARSRRKRDSRKRRQRCSTLIRCRIDTLKSGDKVQLVALVPTRPKSPLPGGHQSQTKEKIQIEPRRSGIQAGKSFKDAPISFRVPGEPAQVGFLFVYPETTAGGSIHAIDKFLKSSASSSGGPSHGSCDAGRLTLNGRTAKAGSVVAVGVVIEVAFANRTSRYEVVSLCEATGREQSAAMVREL